MSQLPSLKAAEVIRALERAGFRVVRVAGSHHRMVHEGDPSRATTVPLHRGRDLAPTLLRAILKQARLTHDQFRTLLDRD